MQIGRHNYEWFFLLYVDRELSDPDRREVEQFVSDNPDLLPELDALLHTRLIPEPDLFFPDKQTLFHSGSNPVTPENHETCFLQLIDGELDPDQLLSVERLLKVHPELSQELALLRQTVLPPEQIICPDKALLYRTGKKATGSGFAGWTRLAIAAAVIGSCFLFWWMVPRSSHSGDGMAGTTLPLKEKSLGPVGMHLKPFQPVTKTRPGSRYTEKGALVRARVTLPGSASRGGNKETLHPVVVLVPAVTLRADSNRQHRLEGIVVLQKVSDNQRIPDQIAKEFPRLSAVPPDTAFEESRKADKIYAALDEDKASMSATYTLLNTSEDNPSALYVGSLEINKNKLRGLFKKASRFLGGKVRETAGDEGKLEVAGWQIDTKKL